MYRRLNLILVVMIGLTLVVGLWLLGLAWSLLGTSVGTSISSVAIIVTILLTSALALLLGSQRWVQWLLRPYRILPRQNDRYAPIMRILEYQANVLKIATPELYVYEGHSINAFIVGGVWRRQHLYLSHILVEQLSYDEIEAVIAHEMAHIYHNDVAINEVAYGMGAACFLVLQWMLKNLLIPVFRQHETVAIAKLLARSFTYGVLLLPLWLLIMFHSRRSEYRADALASHLVGRQQFIWLLHRLKGVCQDSFFYLEPPQKPVREYFSTHPSLHHRISALESHSQA